MESAKIRALNDAFRTTLVGGRVMLTRGIVGRPDCNAWNEKDLGAFEAGRDSVYWKIDYYRTDLSSGSPDPADQKVTTRVLTIMLASEY